MTFPFLQHILASNSVDVRLQKKAVFLVTDLADFQLNSGNSGLPFLSDRIFLKSLVDMLSRFDLDLQEKVLSVVLYCFQFCTSLWLAPLSSKILHSSSELLLLMCNNLLISWFI